MITQSIHHLNMLKMQKRDVWKKVMKMIDDSLPNVSLKVVRLLSPVVIKSATNRL